VAARVSSKTRKKIEWLLWRAEGALLPEAIRENEGAHLKPAEARASLDASAADVAELGLGARAAQLTRAIDDPSLARGYT